MELYVQIIRSSKLFDEEWYKTTYNVSDDPAEHYLSVGWRLGYNPSNFFMTVDYLAMYPDVESDNICPLLHYEVYGKAEGRRIYSRFLRLTDECNLDGKGLEIAPLAQPVCPKSEGFDIETMDHLSMEELKEKYKDDDNVNKDNIVPVDYVWSGEVYKDLIGKSNYYDYIVASHLVEHTTDLIEFFNQCEDILKEKGTLALAVPNKMFSFDYFRENTSLREVIARHELYGDSSRHSTDQIVEYYANLVSLNTKSVWNSTLLEWGQLFKYNHTKEQVQEVIQSKEFLDVHAWVFTPASFRILVHDLWELGYINLKEKAFFFALDGQNEFEFFISLTKDSDRQKAAEFDQERRLYLQQYRQEEEKYIYHRLMQLEEEKRIYAKMARYNTNQNQ